ncbi:MAG: DUF47 family protein [archaeon]|nr:DUF47 family protein [archaeon]MCP8314071.1 DUF47 family protein [archaeon]MCP8320464.1 DUF47 family protein [archaeon]
MFRGEAEVLVRRKTLAILQDEVKLVVEAARELSSAYSALLNYDSATLKTSVEKIKNAEISVEALRRSLARELAEIGAMIMSREDVLRTAYAIENVVHFINGIAFRVSQISGKVIQDSKLSNEIKELVDMAVEIVQRLSEVIRSLTINPAQSIELAGNVEKLERQIDDKYRAITVKVLNEVNSIKDLIVLMDIVERIEDMSDACLSTSDSVTILALGL